MQCDARWKHPLHGRQALADRIDHGHRVFTRLLANGERHGVHTVEAGEAPRLHHAVAHAAEIADPDRGATPNGDGHEPEVRHGPHPTERPHAGLRGPLDDTAGGDLQVLGGEGPADLLKRQAVSFQSLRFDVHGDLALAGAD